MSHSYSGKPLIQGNFIRSSPASLLHTFCSLKQGYNCRHPSSHVEPWRWSMAEQKAETEWESLPVLSLDIRFPGNKGWINGSLVGDGVASFISLGNALVILTCQVEHLSSLVLWKNTLKINLTQACIGRLRSKCPNWSPKGPGLSLHEEPP